MCWERRSMTAVLCFSLVTFCLLLWGVISPSSEQQLVSESSSSPSVRSGGPSDSSQLATIASHFHPLLSPKSTAAPVAEKLSPLSDEAEFARAASSSPSLGLSPNNVSDFQKLMDRSPLPQDLRSFSNRFVRSLLQPTTTVKPPLSQVTLGTCAGPAVRAFPSPPPPAEDEGGVSKLALAAGVRMAVIAGKARRGTTTAAPVPLDPQEEAAVGAFLVAPPPWKNVPSNEAIRITMRMSRRMDLRGTFSADPFGSGTRVPAEFPGEVPWIAMSDEQGGFNLPYTSYAQWRIARSQMLKPGQSCFQARLLIQKFTNFGLGSDLDLLAYSVLHAIGTERLLMFPSYRWRRWATGGCEEYGWGCYFMEPSACSYSNDHIEGAVSVTARQKLHSPHHAIRRVAYKQHWNTRDFSMATGCPTDLHPPNVTVEDVEKAAGMPYWRWAHKQALRFLLRYVQPWVGDMLKESYDGASQFPFHYLKKTKPVASSQATPTVPVVARAPVIAIHLRSMDSGKVHEFYSAMRCGRLSPEAQWGFVEALRTSALGSASNLVPAPVRVFVSFDDPRVYRDLAARYGNATHTVFLDAGFTWPTSFGSGPGDSRDQLSAVYGAGYVMKISLVNLAMSVMADGWVNNDVSGWGRLINNLRATSGRWRCPYVDLMAVHEASKGRWTKHHCEDDKKAV